MADTYYVKYKGRVQGPFTLNQLKHGLKIGKLSRSHHVSSDRKDWQALGDVPGIMPTPEPTPTASAPAAPLEPPASSTEAPAQQTPPPTESAPSAAPTDPSTQYDPRWAASQSQRLIRGLLTACGICMLLFVFLPLLIMDLPNGTRVLWWWSAWSDLNASIQALLIFLVLGGAGLISVANATKGLPRAITTLAILFFMILLMQKAGGSGDFKYAGDFMLATLFLIPLGLMLATTQWRQLGPTIARRVMTCVICSIFTLTAAIWFLDYLFEIDFDDLGTGLAATVMIGVVVMNFAVFGLGVTAGILGIRLVAPLATADSIKRCRLLSKIVFVLLFIGICIITLVEIVDGTSNAEIMSLLIMMIRIAGLGLFAFVMMSYCGCYELMITCSTMALERPVKETTQPVVLQQPPQQQPTQPEPAQPQADHPTPPQGQ